MSEEPRSLRLAIGITYHWVIRAVAYIALAKKVHATLVTLPQREKDLRSRTLHCARRGFSMNSIGGGNKYIMVGNEKQMPLIEFPLLVSKIYVYLIFKYINLIYKILV